MHLQYNAEMYTEGASSLSRLHLVINKK